MHFRSPEHSGWKKFEEVQTKHIKTRKVTLDICKGRYDLVAKTIDGRYIVAAEARYHVVYRAKFENPVPKFENKGPPTSA